MHKEGVGSDFHITLPFGFDQILQKHLKFGYPLENSSKIILTVF